MKKFLFLLCVLLLASCGTVRKVPATPVDLIVGNFNLRGDIDKGDNSWKMRRPRAVERIKAANYDVFGTEECYGYMLEDLRSAIPEYEFYGQCTGDRTGTYSAFFYRKDRFDLVESGDFWFSPTPERISNGWGLNYLRICSWGRLREKGSGREFYFFNTHLDNRGKKSVDESTALRTKCATLLVSKIKELAGNAPAILTGDLNAGPDSEAIRLLTENMQDAYLATVTPPEGPVGTFHGYKPSYKNSSRIDYVLASPDFEVRSYRCVDTDITEGHCASDHYSITAKLVLK